MSKPFAEINMRIALGILSNVINIGQQPVAVITVQIVYKNAALGAKFGVIEECINNSYDVESMLVNPLRDDGAMCAPGGRDIKLAMYAIRSPHLRCNRLKRLSEHFLRSHTLQNRFASDVQIGLWRWSCGHTQRIHEMRFIMAASTCHG